MKMAKGEKLNMFAAFWVVALVVAVEDLVPVVVPTLPEVAIATAESVEEITGDVWIWDAVAVPASTEK